MNENRGRRAPASQAPRGEQGQSLAEFALVLPILLILVFGLIEMAMAWRVFQVVTNVTREGARVAVLATTPDDNPVLARIQSGLEDSNLTYNRDWITLSCDGAGTSICDQSGHETEVRIDYPYTFRLLGPLAGFGGEDNSPFGTVMLTGRTTMRRE